MPSKTLFATLFVSGLLLIQPVLAQDILFDTGRTFFEYAQYPDGPYAGVFEAAGAIDPSDPDFPDGAEGCYGIVIDVGGVYTLLSVSGVLNGDGSVDGAILLVTSTSPLVPGTYLIDPVSFTVNVAFLDNARDVTFPEDPFGFDWEEWLSLIDADHIFIGVSGLIEIVSINAEQVTGTFFGLMADDFGQGMLSEISGGEFEIGHTTVPTTDSSWGQVKALY